MGSVGALHLARCARSVTVGRLPRSCKEGIAPDELAAGCRGRVCGPPSRIMTSVGPLHLLASLVGHGRGPPSVVNRTALPVILKMLAKLCRCATVFVLAWRTRTAVRPRRLLNKHLAVGSVFSASH